ncbi:MAG TPA: glycosyltransferase [bacterium]|jgi:glycosyltransferase involved in cell wall biosynthesis|nr:glycosyltransferase [bacterium]
MGNPAPRKRAAPSPKGMVSVVMPAYNEGLRIRANILAVDRIFKSMGRPYEIVVVDDGSGDWTFEEAKKVTAGARARIRVQRLAVNQGKGYALKEGFRHSRGSWVVFLDSDLDIDPSQVELFFEIQRRDNRDVVIGSKRHPDSKLDYPLKRRVISAGYFFLVKLLFRLPIRDTQTGLKLFRREVLTKVFPKVLVKRYAFDLELLVLANHYGFSIAEAPVVVNYRGKFGHIGLRAVFNIWWDTMAVFYRLNIRRYYDKAGQ